MDDVAIDVEHTGDDETPTKSGMRYQRGVFRSWPPTERKALSHYMLAYYLPSQRRTKLFKALVFGCGLALLFAFFSALSGCGPTWYPEGIPIGVDMQGLDECQRHAVYDAADAWNDAIQARVFVIRDEHYDGRRPRRGHVLFKDDSAGGDDVAAVYENRWFGGIVSVGKECLDWSTYAHELGHVLGLDHDGYLRSIMREHEDGDVILPPHITQARKQLGLQPLSQSTTACAQQDHYMIARWLEVLVPRRPCSPREVTLAMVPVAFDGEVL